jgi:SPP1 family predicted phage head-tail adaptor
MLDLRVELFQPTTVPNNSGQVIKSWASAGTFYAERIVQETAGTEAMPYDQMVSSAFYTWRLRYPNTVMPNWRLVYNSEDYDIVSVIPEGRRRFILVKTRLRDNGTR